MRYLIPVVTFTATLIFWIGDRPLDALVSLGIGFIANDMLKGE